MTTLKVRLLHNASIPGARWCAPVGWEPANTIEGGEWVDGGWWDEDENTAGIVWFGDRDAYGPSEVIDAGLDDLRVASCGDCRVVGEVELRPAGAFYEVRYQGAPYGDNEAGELLSRHRTREAAERALAGLIRVSPLRHHGNTRIVEVRK